MARFARSRAIAGLALAAWVTVVATSHAQFPDTSGALPAAPILPPAMPGAACPAVPCDQPTSCAPPAPAPSPAAAPAVPLTAPDPAFAFRCMVFGDFLYLQARGADVPFAQPFDGVNPLSVPKGTVGVADPDYAPGFRVGAGFALGKSGQEGIFVSYSRYESNTDASIDAPTGLVLRSFAVFPSTLNAAADSLRASARYDIDFHVADADYRKVFCVTDTYRMYWLAGSRFAHLDQDLRGTFSILGKTTVNSSINFDGFGPRLGLGGECLCGHGFYMYGSGVANILFGHFGASYLQRNVFAGTQARTDIGDDRIVPNLELELGMGWTSPSGCLSLRSGYLVSTYCNTMTTNSLIQGVRASNFTTNGDNFRDTLTFDGFTTRIEMRY